MTAPERVERSELFVPAGQWSMLVKAAASEADAVCIDLEDSVPLAAKENARGNVVRALKELNFGGRTRVVRINSLETKFAAEDIGAIVLGAGEHIDLVMVPKVGSPNTVIQVDKLLGQFEAEIDRRIPIGVEAQIETAAGFLYAREIAQTPRLETLIFGSGDYAASMGMPAAGIGTFDEHDELYPGHRWHAVMHTIVAAARANGLRCLDGPYAAHKDAGGFERACKIARSMGFDGKQCIHPAQLAIANKAFSPTKQEVETATAVLAAYVAAAEKGRGAVTLDGKMIDEANVRMARGVLARVERIRK